MAIKRYLFFLLAITFSLYPSCTHKENGWWLSRRDEWANDSNPVGVMYFDGIEFREVGEINYGLGPYRYYGFLDFIHRDNGEVFIQYAPKKMVDKTKTINAEWYNFYYSEHDDGEYVGGSYHYLKGDNKDDMVLLLCRNSKHEKYYVSEADILVSSLILSTSGTYYHGRIDYTAVVIDSLGITHDVEGWAINNPSIDRSGSK